MCIRDRCGMDIGHDHMVVPWLINYAGAVLSLFEVGADGRTAYERRRGKKYRKELPPFAET
eukprot:7322344-Pyramimonas_sp.AAC.1